jgi:hypothetical protein
MAEWKYLEEYHAVVQLPSSKLFGKTIANDVDPEDGPRIALVPRMEAVVRGYRAVHDAAWHRVAEFNEGQHCGCDRCLEALALLRELDGAGKPAEKTTGESPAETPADDVAPERPAIFVTVPPDPVTGDP